MMRSSEAILLVAVLLTVAVVVWFWSRRNWRQHSESLKERFGPEYDRLIERRSRRAGEQELDARQQRMQSVNIVPLSSDEYDRFVSSWSDTQRLFVDDPVAAVRHADELVTQIMTTRGYPVAEFEQRVADVSVDHPGVVQHYRAARVLADGSQEGPAGTEDLRQALVHYRFLFADLLEKAPQQPQAPGGVFRQIRKEAHS
jgi:hypothetical protein